MESCKWLFLPSGPAGTVSAVPEADLPGEGPFWACQSHSSQWGGKCSQVASPGLAHKLAVSPWAGQVRLPPRSWDEEVAAWLALPWLMSWTNSSWLQALSCPGSQDLPWENVKDSLHSFTHIFAEHLLCAWPWARCWRDNGRQDRESLAPSGVNQPSTSHKGTGS